MRKEVRKVLKRLDQQGWRVESRRNGMMLFPPDQTKSPVVVHGTPSDHRAYRNFLSDLRRAGYTP